MVTRRKAGVVKPNPRYANTAEVDDVPCIVRAALRDPAWFAAMQDEFRALQENNTWELVHDRLVLMSSRANGSSKTSFTLMVGWNAGKHVGSCAAFPSAPI